MTADEPHFLNINSCIAECVLGSFFIKCVCVISLNIYKDLERLEVRNG